MPINSFFSSDKPVSTSQDDQFQRYGFAKRIAEIITNRENKECIVVGIYGSWGEGKTSVLNFIENELGNSENVISFKFNPWRYNDENALLLQFFKSLGYVLENKLKNSTEKIGELLKKYGDSLSFNIPVIGNISGAAKALGSALDKVDIETLKDRIENVLVTTNKKVVVFIDDIDRLDKQEIYSILRLVKLNADFSNIVYVLSFDELMVSHAIGEKYGDGSAISGQNFLEKIIQIPLRLPVAQIDALNKFCYKFVDATYISNKLQLDDSELKRFGFQFTNNVLPMLTTPRLAVRYGNSISFSIPLLNGEVNIVDLLLIEAVKIFYPEFYDFIKYNPDFFIGSYSIRYSGSNDQEKRNFFKEKFEKLGINLSRKQKECIEDLLQELFPVLKEVFSNYSYGNSRAINWNKYKNIASANYFNRYFSYTTINGEISDVEFDDFLANVESNTIKEISSRIKYFVSSSTPQTFLHKLRIWEEDFSWEVGKKLVKAISSISEIFPKNEHLFMMMFEHPNGQAAIFIKQILKKHNNKQENLKLVKYLIGHSKHFDFVYTIYYWIRPDPEQNDNIFTLEDFNTIRKYLVDRALKEAKESPLFEKFPDNVLFVFDAWKDIDKQGLESYVGKILDKSAKYVTGLIQAYAPTTTSNSHPQPYKGDIEEERYNYFKSIISEHIIYSAINKHFEQDYLNKEPVSWSGHFEKNPSTINMVRQYLYWYNKQNS